MAKKTYRCKCGARIVEASKQPPYLRQMRRLQHDAGKRSARPGLSDTP